MLYENQYGMCEILIKDDHNVCVNVSGGPDSAFLLWAVANSVTTQNIIAKVITYDQWPLGFASVKAIVEKVGGIFPAIEFTISHTHNDGSIPINEFLNSIPHNTTQVFNGFQCNPPKQRLVDDGIYDIREVYKDRDRVMFPDEYRGQFWPMRFTSKQWLGQAIIDYDLHWIHDLTATCDDSFISGQPCKQCYGCVERRLYMGSYDRGALE